MSNNWNNRLSSNNHPLSPFWCERRNNHPRILFEEIRYGMSFVFVYWKCPAENSGNGSSEPLNLKDFMGIMRPPWGRATTWWKYHIQPFREWLSEKMCTWQSPKVIWDMINTVAVEPTFEAGQCKTQTADYCFHHTNEYVTTIVPLFSNPKNNSP